MCVFKLCSLQLWGKNIMYKTSDYENVQLSFVNFNTTCGMQLDVKNEWIQKASWLPWRAWESLYEAMFPSHTGNVAKTARMVLGSFIIQMRMGLSDRDLVEQIRQNPYYQYFIGLDAFQHNAPFSPTALVEWRKRISVDFVIRANALLCDATPVSRLTKRGRKKQNAGTLIATQICDATVTPQYIRFPQDVSLLNEAREKLEKMICCICQTHDIDKPRIYSRVAHKEYLSFAKSKRPSAEKIRNAIKGQLNYVRRDINFVDSCIEKGYVLPPKDIETLATIRKLYEQQLYMYKNKTHKVEDRIVSISQPYVRPIVRGKASRPTEFGAKLHLSIDEHGFGRIEYISFNAYNEGPMLIDAINAYQYRNGFYPERVLVDQIYRSRENLAFCKKHNIRISGPKLGKPVQDPAEKRKNRRTYLKDSTDRIEVERYFSTAKRRNGMGMIKRKREDTSLSTIAMSVLVTNIFGTFQSAIDAYTKNNSVSETAG